MNTEVYISSRTLQPHFCYKPAGDILAVQTLSVLKVWKPSTNLEIAKRRLGIVFLGSLLFYVFLEKIYTILSKIEEEKYDFMFKLYYKAHFTSFHRGEYKQAIEGSQKRCHQRVGSKHTQLKNMADFCLTPFDRVCSCALSLHRIKSKLNLSKMWTNWEWTNLLSDKTCGCVQGSLQRIVYSTKSPVLYIENTAQNTIHYRLHTADCKLNIKDCTKHNKL